MKNLVLGLLASCSVCMAFGQNDAGLAAYDAFWKKIDGEYKDPEHSPLKADMIADFDSIARFPFDADFRVEAYWKATKREKPQKFATSSKEKRTYQKVADLVFVLKGDTLSLAAFQNLELMRNPAYQDYIFVPFTDDTNGGETYGGGRYLDFTRPETDSLTVDFNHCYNPYCAYTDGYSCPVPPRENSLPLKIMAGARVDAK